MHVLWIVFSDQPAARFERALLKASLFRRWSAFRRGLTLGVPIFAVRTDVTSVKLAANSDFLPVGTAVDVTNGMRVLFSKLRKLFILVTNTAAATKVVTVHHATTSQDILTDFASQAIAITAGMDIIGPFKGTYVQADGTLWLDFVAGHTGIVAPFELPN